MRYILSTTNQPTSNDPLLMQAEITFISGPHSGKTYVWIDRANADTVARAISAACHPSSVVTLLIGRVIKAVYQNGEPTRVVDFKTIFVNIPEEEYKASQYLCSVTGKMI